MTRTTLALTLAMLLVPALAGAATPPKAINFQGRLADAAGTPRTGSYSMKFSIYNASTAGTQCFLEQQVVAANSGLFNVNIGSVTPIGCTFTEAYWLQIDITINGTTWETMSPRLALTAAAYAFRAYTAANSDQLGGYSLGAASGNIPRNTGGVMANLNADMVDNMHVTDILGAINTPLYQQNAGCGVSDTVRLSATTQCQISLCATYPATPSGCTSVSTSTSSSNNCNCDTESCSSRTYYRTINCTNTLKGYLKTP